MGGSIIKNIKSTKCGWDGKPLDGHSHKNLMRCLYKSNVEVFRSIQVLDAKEVEIKKLQRELGKFVIEEQEKKADTGLMDVKKPLDIVDAPPLNIGKDKAKNDKELAKDLLKAEKNGRSTK